MFNITIEELTEFLRDGNDVEIFAKEDLFLIEPMLNIDFDNPDENNQPLTELSGYIVNGKEYNDATAFKKALIKLGVSQTVTVNKVADFFTKEDYVENKEFQNADMKYLLEKYKHCNIFALCSYYGDNAISEEESEKAYEKLLKYNKNYLLKSYEKFKTEYRLPPFEEAEETVKEECLEFERKNRDKFLKKHGFFEVSFICDEVGKNTKFSKPTELFWHFYHTKGNEIDCKRLLDDLAKKTQPFGVYDIFSKEEYRPLKDNLVKHEVTFNTHCTGGPLQIQYYFRLNENSKKWLLKHKTDYDIDGELQDLAFYEDDKLRFSSCTHEGFHNDVKQ